MATGRLSNTEKFAIKGMIAEGKDFATIAKQLDRSEVTIAKYVSGELSDIIDTVVKSRIEQYENDVEDAKEDGAVEEPTQEAPSKIKIPSEMMVETVHKLKAAGFNRDDAKELIQRIARTLQFQPDNATQLYAYCVRALNSQDLMIKRAAGGRKGIAGMTQAASERIDEFHKNHPTQGTRRVRECVFQPKDGKMMNENE